MQEIKRDLKKIIPRKSLDYLSENQYEKWEKEYTTTASLIQQELNYLCRKDFFEIQNTREYLDFENQIEEHIEKSEEWEQLALELYTNALKNDKDTILSHVEHILNTTSSNVILSTMFMAVKRHIRQKQFVFYKGTSEQEEKEYLEAIQNIPFENIGLYEAILFDLDERLSEQIIVCDTYNYTDIKDLLKEKAKEKATQIIKELTADKKEELEEAIKECSESYQRGKHLYHNIHNIIPTGDTTLKHLRNRLTPIAKPQKFYENNTIMSNELVEMYDSLLKEMPNGQITLLPTKVKEYNPLGKKSKVEVYNKISFTYGGELSFNKARIKEYDLLVLDAVCTLLYAGNDVLTDADIYRTLKGNTKTKPTAKQLERIKIAMLKLSGTRMYADITEELNNMTLNTDNEEILKGTWDKAIVEYDGLELTAQNGSVVKAYSFRDNAGNIRYPMIMQYCHVKNQVISYPIKLLDTPEHYTEDYAVIKSYLLKEITNLKNGHRYGQHTLSYFTMYNKCGLEEPTDKTIKKRDREVIKKMLDYWKEEKYIEGYVDQKKGRTITGIEIIL